MTDRDCREVLLDFLYDRGVFASAKEFEGPEASTKPNLFIAFHRKLSEPDQAMMNLQLMAALMGKDEELARFGGIFLQLLLAVLRRSSANGLEAFQPSLLQELRDPAKQQGWLRGSEESPDFRRDWRYAVGLIRILRSLGSPEVIEIASEMATLARSPEFRNKLEEILADDPRPR